MYFYSKIITVFKTKEISDSYNIALRCTILFLTYTETGLMSDPMKDG